MTKKLRGGGLGARAGVTPTRTVQGLMAPQLPHRPGRWIGPTYAAGATETGTFPANILWVLPLYVPVGRVYDRIGIRREADTTPRNARFGIYADDGDGAPSDLILDAGEINLAPSGNHEIAVEQFLEGGHWYWLAFVLQSSTDSLLRWAGNMAISSGIGTSTAGTLGSSAGMLERSFTYGALPDPFGAITGTRIQLAAVRLRVADPQPT